MSKTLPPISSPRYQGRFAIAVPEIGIPYLAEASLKIVAPHERHSHDEIQVLWVLQGEMGMEIGRSMNRIAAGQGLVLWPGRRHRVVPPTPDQSPAQAQIVDLRLVDDPSRSMPAFLRNLVQNQVVTGDAERMNGAAGRLRTARSAAGPQRTARVLSAVWDLLAELAGTPPTDLPSLPPHPDSADDHRLRVAEQFMTDRLSDRIGVEDVADHVRLSRSQLTRLMMVQRGVGPAQRLRQLRVGRAAELLRGSTLSIKEIARVCGFATRHHFSRVFFESTGKRPSDVR